MQPTSPTSTTSRLVGSREPEVHNVFFLLIAVGIVLLGLLGIGVYQLMNRPRHDAGIHEFKVARDALANFHHRDGKAAASGRRRRR